MKPDAELLEALDAGTATDQDLLGWELGYFGSMLDEMQTCVELPDNAIPIQAQERVELTRALVFLAVVQHHEQLKRALSESKTTH